MTPEVEAAAALLADPGVLAPLPALAVNHGAAVEAHGGLVVLPWRADALAAEQAGLTVASTLSAVNRSFPQAVVVADRHRAATWNACAASWKFLEPGGRLVVAGSNTVGVRTTLKRLATALGQQPEVVAQRARSRVAVFERTAVALDLVADESIVLPIGGAALALQADPAVFSSGRLDDGSALLLEYLSYEPVPQSLADLGCGHGVLAIAALHHWSEARATLGEADARAVASARANVAALGMAERAQIHWWDADEAWPGQQVDLVLCNPPFHAGQSVDYRAVQGMFRTMRTIVRPGGRALIVANRHLPYEKDVAALGQVAVIAERDGFKLFSLTC